MSTWDEIATEYEQNWESTTGQTVDRLLEWIDPRDGIHVVDVAAGPGIVTVAMARRGARVSASDYSPAMVGRLRARVVEEGLGDRVAAEVANGESLPYPDASCDAAVSNFGVIFCPDVDAGLGQLARVTRPGGRLAMTAWSVEQHNGWTTLLRPDYAAELGFELGPRPAYRWESRDAFAGALGRAGWRDVDVETIPFPVTVYSSAEDVVRSLDSPATRVALAGLPPERVERLGQYLVRRARELHGDGKVALPREAWLARATA